MHVQHTWGAGAVFAAVLPAFEEEILEGSDALALLHVAVRGNVLVGSATDTAGDEV